MILRVNLTDGRTVSFNLKKKSDTQAWEQVKINPDDITAIGVYFDGVLNTVVIPSPREGVVFDAGPVLHKDGSGRLIGVFVGVEFSGVVAKTIFFINGNAKSSRFTLENVGGSGK